MVAVVIRRGLVAVALLGCMRWRPLASADVAREARSLPTRVVRVAERDGTRELRVHRAMGSVVEGWDPSRGREVRVDLAAAQGVWVREAAEGMNALIVGGAYALVFVVSCLGLIIDRR